MIYKRTTQQLAFTTKSYRQSITSQNKTNQEIARARMRTIHTNTHSHAIFQILEKYMALWGRFNNQTTQWRHDAGSDVTQLSSPCRQLSQLQRNSLVYFLAGMIPRQARGSGITLSHSQHNLQLQAVGTSKDLMNTRWISGQTKFTFLRTKLVGAHLYSLLMS